MDDHEPVRRRLRELDAKFIGNVLEINRFLDKPAGLLRRSGRGLRIRTNTDLDSGHATHIITHKGVVQSGPTKRREEIEVEVDDPEQAIKLLAALGLAVNLVFEKRRESWKLGDCKIELDQLPHFGTFVEIEGPSDEEVIQMRQRLGLDQAPVIKESYAGMMREHLTGRRGLERVVRF